MLIYCNGEKSGLPPALGKEGTVVVVASYAEMKDGLALLGIDAAADPVNDPDGSTHYESHLHYEFFHVRKPDLSLEGEGFFTVSVFFAGKHIALFTDDSAPGTDMSAALEKRPEAAPAHLLSHFFSRLSTSDADALGDIEDYLARFETTVLAGKQESATQELLTVRKKLLVLKRYYEALFDLLQDMEENPGGYFSNQQLAHLRMHTNKADRLSNTVNNLREYAVQVREAWQNQLDIRQNEIMKLFTVITAIFLPLTLITGWYGMNLQMPEYGQAATYPVVIGLSILVAGLLLVYFRKKNGFESRKAAASFACSGLFL